ncbi:uncharacterized protein LOC109723078 [Ananas comosus]|uniref:Transmembrane protein 205 n=1 Tax=Ananas comosus TaxID=4615 RepID=A0A199ULA3_ANACO|nr:uncharacterized protein LOC109723078 [Ananas comosus]OAY65486.1 Transmembrane protein 205 [Ananas comosus]
MLNFVAVALLATTLAAAGLWSPSPEPHHHHQLRRDEILLEGHRVIVVEYERRVPIGEPEEEPTHHSAAKDKICDAYGVCRDKLSTLLGKTKDKLSEAEDFAEDKAHQVKEGAEDAISKAKDKAAQLKEGAKDAAKSTKDAAERAVDKAAGATDALRDAAGAAEEKGRDAAANASASAVAKAEHVTGTNLSDVARRAREVARDGAACAWARAPGAGRAAAGVAHLVAAAAAYGTCVWVTFVSSHVLAAALPRQLFGVVQSKLYPVYFRAVAYCVGAALLAQLLGRDRRFAAERVQSYNLLGVLALVLVNMLFLEPKATKAMFERMKLEKEEGRGRDIADMVEPATTAGSPTTATATATATASAVPRNATKGTMADPEMMKSRITKLNKRLKMLNNYSSTLNIVTMMGLSWHLVHLAHQLQKQC